MKANNCLFKTIMLYFLTIAASLFACLQTGEPRSISECSEDSSYPVLDTSNLEAVFIFMRHGIRAPWTTYPLDPNINDTTRWPNGRSQLTPFGVEQAKNIGKILKTRYGSFVNTIKRSQVYIRASSAQRCIDTANFVKNQIWQGRNPSNESFIYSLPKKIDSVLWEDPDCPGADEEEEKNMKTPTVAKFEAQPDIVNLYKFVSEKTGLPATMSGVDKAFDCIRCERINGYSNAEWATDDVYNQMGNVYTKHLNFLYSSVSSRRMRAGPMLQEIVDHVNNLRKASDADRAAMRKVFLYTTHDYKIAAMLLSLGENLNRYPPFAATVMFEIHRNKLHNDHEVHVNYISQTEHEPYFIEKLSMQQCLGMVNYRCSFDGFVSSVKDYLGVKWTNECKLKNFNGIDAAEEDIGNS